MNDVPENECCTQVLAEEWRKIHHRKPFLHYCHEWDLLLIDVNDPEFDACTCFERIELGAPVARKESARE